MIAYDLQCANGHTFEGWFEDEKSYKTQQSKKLIACPMCDGTSVHRIPSTFSIKSSQTSMKLSQKVPDMEKLGEQIVDYVEKNFDDVGTNFATEALKIHYGASEPRNIRGVSTKQEEETLDEEGIQFFKIPMRSTPDTDS
jgi:hypothetical protein